MAPSNCGEPSGAHAKAFRKEIKWDILKPWLDGKERLRRIKSLRLAERFKNGNSLEHQRLWEAQLEEEHHQCLLMAPTPVELRWKKRENCWRSDLPEAVKEAIALDEKRFAGGAA